MKEIEVKVLEVDPVAVVGRLDQLGAELVEKGLVTVKAYDFPDNRLRDNGQYIRVRRIADRVELVFKNRIETGEVKISEETEVTVSDFDTVCELFENLGMNMFAHQEKYRATYKLDGVKVEFDKYPGIAWFFEVEASSTAGVKDMVERLGFDPSDKGKVSSRMIREIYGDHVHFISFDKIGEDPDYGRMFKEKRR